MSYASFFQSLPEKLSQPTSIAVMASVGIHALLGLTLPPLLSREKPAKPDAVQLMELTPLELSRLPQPSPSLPSLSNQLSPLPPFPPLPSSPLQPPPSGNTSLYQFPLSSLPSGSTEQFSLPPLPSSGSIRLRRPNRSLPNSISRIYQSPQRSKPNTPLPPLPSTNPRNSRPLGPLGVKPSLPEEFTPEASDSERFTPETAPPQRQYSIARDYQFRRFPAPPETPQETPQVSVKPETAPPEFSNSNDNEKPQLEASPEQNPIALQQQRAVVALSEELRQRRNSIRADGTNTSNDEARKNYVAWLDSVNQKQPEVNQATTEPISLTGTYPRDACVRKLQGTSVYGVSVDSNGKVTDSQLIRSSGYQIFNDQARADIKGRSFANPTGKPKLYRVNVQFAYNPQTCPSLTLFQDTAPQDSVTEDNAPQNLTPQESEEKKPVAPASERPTPPTAESEEKKPATPASERPTPPTAESEDKKPATPAVEAQETATPTSETEEPVAPATEVEKPATKKPVTEDSPQR
ncbi:TonB family protein [Lyngbya aestuarii]|uniref:TonB family protein n=1 Tax=Lyngbya aestuarii TaxID=118322 RepID=UPI00403DEEE4